MDESPQVTAHNATVGEEAPPAVTPDVPAAKKPKRSKVEPPAKQRNVTVAGEEATTSKATSIRQTPQTERVYSFSEAELVDLLIGFERLVDQEHKARFERIPHETVLPLVRRTLRVGKPLPTGSNSPGLRQQRGT